MIEITSNVTRTLGKALLMSGAPVNIISKNGMVSGIKFNIVEVAHSRTLERLYHVHLLP